MIEVKYPNVSVTLVGTDCSALAVVGAVIRALRKAGVAPRAIDDYQAEALSGDYNHLLSVTMETVEVE
tara:strand:- start:195 stop:398 length:204 start_codon:yes stop_codon:yes gene_type:complete